jgi:hypothetical protein
MVQVTLTSQTVKDAAKINTQARTRQLTALIKLRNV